MYDTSLSKMYQGYVAMQKENKRCIPKEGMPHASACQKKDSPLSKKREKGEMVHTKGLHTPSTKNIHTLAVRITGVFDPRGGGGE